MNKNSVTFGLRAQGRANPIGMEQKRKALGGTSGKDVRMGDQTGIGTLSIEDGDAEICLVEHRNVVEAVSHARNLAFQALGIALLELSGACAGKGYDLHAQRVALGVDGPVGVSREHCHVRHANEFGDELGSARRQYAIYGDGAVVV